VREYRFDRDHNSPFRRARALRDGPHAGGQADAARLAEVTRALEGDDPAAQREALRALAGLDPATRQAALATVLRLADRSKDPGVRQAATAVVRGALGPVAYPRTEVEQVRELTECRPTGTSSRPREADGRLRLTARVAANGCNFLVIDRDQGRPEGGVPGR
jgi:hypothetical protein